MSNRWKPTWVRDRDINGNYGYRNTKTGEFRSTMPNSVEEKKVQQQKRNDAVVNQYVRNKTRFDNTDAKRRNHSSETQKKYIRKPQLIADNKGNYQTYYSQPELAKGEDSVDGVDPIGTLIVGNALLNKPLQLVGKGVLYSLGKLGDDWARNRIVNNIFNNNIKSWDGTVSASYFNSPNNWYRVTETPELYGIKEMGKNVTTTDAVESMSVPSNNWRIGVINNRLNFNEGWTIPKTKPKFNLTKFGSAHGNTTQAAKGQIWGGTFAQSRRFPTVILEGNIKNRVYSGYNPQTKTDSRSLFVIRDWDELPLGARLGFHTGEMPMEQLSAFQQLSNGRFKYLGEVVPYKTQPSFSSKNFIYSDKTKVPEDNSMQFHLHRIVNGAIDKIKGQGDTMSDNLPRVFSYPSQTYDIVKEVISKTGRSDGQMLQELGEILKHTHIAQSLDYGKKPLGIVVKEDKVNKLSSAVSHELDHAIHVPYEYPRGFSDNMPTYFRENNGSELAARGSQLKDYFKLTNPNQEITEDMLKYAAQNYIKDTGINNNMSDFFSSIQDWKEAAKWLSKYATGISIPLITAKNN